MDEVTGFALSQEELLACLLISQIPLPVGFDQLQAQVLGGLGPEVRAPLLAAIERSLLAHGFLDTTSGQPVVVDFVQARLNLCARPAQTWVVLHQPGAAATRTSCFYAQGSQVLAHIALAGIHQFVDLKQPADIAATALQLLAPLPTAASDGPAEFIPETLFTQLAQAQPRPPAATIATELANNGMSAATAQALATALAAPQAITAFVRFDHAQSEHPTLAFTIVQDAAGHWGLLPEAPNRLRVRALSAPTLTDVVQKFTAAWPTA